MTLFLDNDALQKLATLDLLGEAVSIASASSVHVLGTARHRYAKTGRKKLGEAVVERILAFIATCGEIHDAPEGLASFQDKPGIDGGEAILLLSAATTGSAVMWTGDKRCLIALAGDPTLGDVVQALAGRVFCFEQLMVRLIDAHGFAYVHRKVLAAPPGWDRAVESVAFGSGVHATEANVRAALDGYVADLRGKTGLLLAT